MFDVTTKQVFENALRDLNKKGVPSLQLEDYNYFLNKAIKHYANDRYRQYNVNQQLTDDLQVLVGSVVVDFGIYTKTDTSVPVTYSGSYVGTGTAEFMDDTEVIKFHLPPNYYHMLAVDIGYLTLQKYKNYDEGSSPKWGSTRITADMRSALNQNYYDRPDYRRPYHYITDIKDPLNGVVDSYDQYADYSRIRTGAEPNTENYSNDVLFRYPAIEILPGQTFPSFRVTTCKVDYLRAPKTVRLTIEQVKATEDTSQRMEFPDYVCQEITNTLVNILLENAGDGRTGTFKPVNQSIPDQAQPASQKTN